MKRDRSGWAEYDAVVMSFKLTRLKNERLHISRHDGRQRVVRRHGDIGRLIIAARLCDDAFHFDDAVLGIDDRMAACGLGRQFDEIAKDAVAECVMGDLAQALVLIGRHSNDVKDQGLLRLGAHHAVQGRQLADAIGRR
jgi:hypothetical protein